jgi:hypothetical protein
VVCDEKIVVVGLKSFPSGGAILSPVNEAVRESIGVEQAKVGVLVNDKDTMGWMGSALS